MQSMTGYGSVTATLSDSNNQKAHLSITIKSLNGRYLEFSCKAPSYLQGLEPEFLKLCKKKLIRGSIQCNLYIDNPSFFKGNIELDKTTVNAYIKALNAIEKELNITEPISLNHLLSLPNLFFWSEPELSESVKKTILEAMNKVLDLVIDQRTLEGNSLQKDIAHRIAQLQRLITIIEKRSNELIQEQKEKINTLLQELTGDTSEWAAARKDSLMSYLDKLDIHEEITRFQSHLAKIDHILKSKELEKGKLLDFTLQELSREINTITSKCPDSIISTHAIDAKVEIEKAREQVQNIV